MKTAIAVVGVALAAAGCKTKVVIVSAAPPISSTSAARASASNAPLSGCEPVQTVPPFTPASDDNAHVVPADMPPLSSYPSLPPASGPHDAVPLAAGVYETPPSLGSAIHSLEHGAVIVWLSPEAATGSQAEAIKAEFATADHVIVAPFDYPDQGEASDALLSGTKMALVAWHHVQTCPAPDVQTARTFVAQYRATADVGPEYLGDAPEAGAPIS